MEKTKKMLRKPRKTQAYCLEALVFVWIFILLFSEFSETKDLNKKL